MKHDWSSGEAIGKTTAGLVGGGVLTLSLMILAGALPARLGLDPGLPVAAAVWLALPVWATAGCVAVLARNGRAAWVRVGSLAVVLAAGVAGVALL